MVNKINTISITLYILVYIYILVSSFISRDSSYHLVSFPNPIQLLCCFQIHFTFMCYRPNNVIHTPTHTHPTWVHFLFKSVKKREKQKGAVVLSLIITQVITFVFHCMCVCVYIFEFELLSNVTSSQPWKP